MTIIETWLADKRIGLKNERPTDQFQATAFIWRKNTSNEK